MAIYEGSRYTNVYTNEVEDSKGNLVTFFTMRELPIVNTEDSIKHTWIEGDRLDILANRYYDDPQHWWFILDSNTRYMEESEIKNGDELTIPPLEELLKVITQDE